MQECPLTPLAFHFRRCTVFLFSISAQVPDRRRRGQRPGVHPVRPARPRPQPHRRQPGRRERRLRRQRGQQQFGGGKLKLRLSAVGPHQARRVALPAHRSRGMLDDANYLFDLHDT